MTTAPSVGQRTWASPRCWLILLAIVAAGLGLDLWTKAWAFRTVAGEPVVVARHALLDNPSYNPIPQHESVVVIPGRILDFHLVLNSGAVFGIGSDQRTFFVCFTLAAVLISFYIFGWQTSRRSWLAHLGIGLVLAGALGNLWDRLMVGRVRDFLHLFPDRHLPFGWHWPGGGSEVFPWVFNVADALLLTGMGILLVHLHLSDRQHRRKKAEASRESTADS